MIMYPKLILHRSASPREFVDIWHKLYVYPQELLYVDNIVKQVLNIRDMTDLYIWKNGTRLSAKKEVAFNVKIIARLETINSLKANFDIDRFLVNFSDVSTIWKIFLLHIIAPQTFPIFDQHVYRAYHYMEYGAVKEIPFDNPAKESLYFDAYLTFFNQFAETSGKSRKHIDEALFSFGRFLKTPYAALANE